MKPGACFARTTYNKDCDGLFNNSIGLSNGQGVQLNYIGGDFGFSTKVFLYCDPSSPTWRDIAVTIGLNEDTVEAHGLAACPLGTVIPPVTSAPSLPPPLNYTSCSLPMYTTTGHTYDISSLVGRTIRGMVKQQEYAISVCSSLPSSCGLCNFASFCEEEPWFDNCVGQFSSAVPNADGSGVTLYYPNGEFQRAGVLYLLCGTGAVNATITSNGNVATFYTAAACPAGTVAPAPPNPNPNPVVSSPISTYNLLMAIGLAVAVALLITLIIIAIVYLKRGRRAEYQQIAGQ